jgi:hypothetical protein
MTWPRAAKRTPRDPLAVVNKSGEAAATKDQEHGLLWFTETCRLTPAGKAPRPALGGVGGVRAGGRSRSPDAA